MSVQQVLLSKIFAKPEDNSYRGREDDPYSKDALKGLMDSIKMQGGINTPLLLQARPDGTFEVGDGHRRFFSLQWLIEDGVAAFSADMLVPANVLGDRHGRADLRHRERVGEHRARTAPC